MNLVLAIVELAAGGLLITKAISGASWRQILAGQATQVYALNHGRGGTVAPGQSPSAANAGNATSSAALNGAQHVTAAALMKQFTAAGLSRAGAAAIIGNFTQESSLNPSLNVQNGPMGQGVGLASWTSGRVTALQQYAAAHGVPWNSVDAQVGFTMKELAAYPSLLAQLKSGAGGAAALALAFSQQFERPAAWAADNANREAYAQSALGAH